MRKPGPVATPFDPLEAGLPAVEWNERLLLGMALLYSDRMPELAGQLLLDDFTTESRRLIWTACTSLHEAGAPISVHGVVTELQKFGQLEAAGGISALLDLTDRVPNLSPIAKYVATLRDATQKRRAMLRSNEIMIQAGQHDCDTANVLLTAAEDFTRLAADLNPDTTFKAPAQILAAAGGLNGYTSGDGAAVGIVPTPFERLNRIISAGGFCAGDLVILAGQTGRGKTAFVVNLAFHASQEGKRTAFVSLEMPEGQIFDRLVSLAGDLNSYQLRRKNADVDKETDRRARVREAVNLVSTLPIAITYRPGITPKMLQNELRRLQAQQGLDLVIVDYLQLMSGGSSRFGTRTEEVSAISRALKRMAGELSVPIVALSQFSRESSKENREPRLDDLRESGSIEQDGSLVLFVHFTRPWDMRAGVETGDVKLIIAKQRNGACTWVPLTFHAPTGRFYESEREAA